MDTGNDSRTEDRLCWLGVRVPDVPGSIPGASRISEKEWGVRIIEEVLE
jgi:hypothetical protein